MVRVRWGFVVLVCGGARSCIEGRVAPLKSIIEERFCRSLSAQEAGLPRPDVMRANDESTQTSKRAEDTDGNHSTTNAGLYVWLCSCSSNEVDRSHLWSQCWCRTGRKEGEERGW